MLERVHAIEGIERIRFTSPHPRGFKDDLVAAYGRLPKLCGYVHLPMQSGSNRILRAMNRPYSRERYREIVDALRAVGPGFAVGLGALVLSHGVSFAWNFLYRREYHGMSVLGLIVRFGGFGRGWRG